MKWIIKGRYSGEVEEIDETDGTREYADYLVSEYRMAFGPDWEIWKERGKG